ncbi:MAG TPA: Gmad2 immunoglobulin-like domain-containing protein [Candidatus Portnoybacteria bacterium]|nr:Gmad2 immunoglobulin-like domain-containing protein [Candidatus Portnoybacteria bacterium]
MNNNRVGKIAINVFAGSVLLLVAAGACYFLIVQKKSAISNFEQCAAAGNSIIKNYPRQCAAGGKTFTESVSVGNDKIKVEMPLASALVQSPLKIKGQARGTWYFEASFPVKLIDSNGKILASAPAQAQGDWMTEDWVPFELSLSFDAPQSASGVLILQKDNPSGLPVNDDSISVPVRFK